MVHFWDPLVDGPIRLMVQIEIIARDIFRSSSLYQIQPVQPNIQQSVVNISNSDLHVIIKVSPLVQWSLTWNICVINVPILLMVQMEINARELSRSSSLSQIWLVQPKIQQSVVHRSNCEVHFIINVSPLVQLGSTCNISLCCWHSNTASVSDSNNRLNGKSRARAY